MKNNYSRQHEQRILRERLEEQRQRRVFSGLQQAENKRKLWKLHSPVNTLDAQLKRYTPVPMGLPQTSREWLAESEKNKEETKSEKNEEHQYQSEEMRTRRRQPRERQKRRILLRGHGTLPSQEVGRVV
jgi:hypothetical protein